MRDEVVARIPGRKTRGRFFAQLRIFLHVSRMPKRARTETALDREMGEIRSVSRKWIKADDIIPSKATVNLPYATSFNPLSGTAVTGTSIQVFSLNNCHDPDFTFTGHQPRSWDQYKLFYLRYRVIGCKWSIHWRNDASATGNANND